MIYKVKKEEQEFEVDDTVLFDEQPKGFRNAYLSVKKGDIAEFDNCNILVLYTRRVIITLKEE
jgi:hypothetical protein